MAVNDVTYSSQTVLANLSRLASLADGEARTFGEIVGAGELSNGIHLTLPINASAVGGTYQLYLVESQDGAVWTDNIDPTGDTGDVAAKIEDAIPLMTISTIYNVTTRPDAIVHLLVSMLTSAKYIGLVLLNDSGFAMPASGADGDSVTYKIASS